MEQQFQDIVDKHTFIKNKAVTKHNIIGAIKLILVIAFVSCMYYLFSTKMDYTIITVSIVLAFAYFLFATYQTKLKKIVAYSRDMIILANKNISRIDGSWSNFNDIGKEYIDYNHDYAFDLDIVGQKSIFQMLNSTYTWHGRRYFSNDLLNANYNEKDIIERQEAIQELANDLYFTNEFEVNAMSITADSSTEYLVNALTNDKMFIENSILENIYRYIPYISVIILLFGYVFNQTYFMFYVMIVMLIHSVLVAIKSLQATRYIEAISGLPSRLASISSLINVIASKNFSSKKLQDIQAVLLYDKDSASKALKKLDTIAGFTHLKANPLVYAPLAVAVFLDIQIAISFQRWKIKYGKEAEDWFQAIGELESLCSFAVLPRVCNNVSMPSISTNKKVLHVEQMGHPLIDNKKRVNNDTIVNDNIFIISGSNMSGKTTYLRTVGINVVLAKCGSYTCTKNMTFYPMKVMTSMRIVDDLNEGISTFYAELKRIKNIIDAVDKDDNILFLIDEIFRGTNSIDRLSGAKEVLGNLDSRGLTGMITTHDLDLCMLSKSSTRIKNYSFSEYYEDKKILFDYKLHEGRSLTTNAKFLMEILGIIKKQDSN